MTEGASRARARGRRHWLAFVVTWLSILFLQGTAVAQEPKETKRIWYVGTVVDGPSVGNDRLRKLVMREIRSLAGGDFAVKFKKSKRLTGDFTQKTIQAHLDAQMADERVDLVLGFGPISSHLLVSTPDLKKPALAPFVIDEGAQGLLDPAGKPRPRKNLSYVLWHIDLERDFKTFREFGDFKKVAILISAHTARAVPKLGPGVIAQAKKIGVDLLPVLVESSVPEALKAIPPEAQAVYVAPLPQFTKKDMAALAAGLKERKLPSFSWIGRADVEQGILVGLGSPKDFERLARRVALNMQAIMLGEPAETQARSFQLAEAPVVNMATARAVGVWPNWSLITEAELLQNARKKVSRKLTLKRAVNEAMKGNLDILMTRARIRVARENINRARAGLFPQLSVGVTGRIIDKDRAGLGTAERSLYWTAQLNQSLYNESIYANLKIQKHLRKSKVAEQQAVRLDVVREVTVAYLTVLKAQTYEKIRRDNLDLSRSNLALAKVRKDLGSGTRSEVLRWESQIASARSLLIGAAAARNLSEIQLNRLLNRPLEEPFVLQEASAKSPKPIAGEQRFAAYLNNPWRFKVLREFMTREAQRNAPELRQIRTAVLAKKRELKSYRRAYYLPKVGVSAGTTHRFLQGGAGTEPTDTSSIPPAFQGFVDSFPSPNSFDWQVGVSASLSLFEGGARYATVRKAQAELTELTLHQKLAKQQIDQRMRSALHRVGASFPIISLSQDAAKAGAENLKLVTEAYSRGAASIVQLLDAQNQSLVADQSAANAVFDFMIDLMDVERAAGQFEFFKKKKDIDKFFKRLDALSRKRSREQKVTLPNAN